MGCSCEPTRPCDALACPGCLALEARGLHAATEHLGHRRRADADLAVVMDRSPGIRATLRESQITLILSCGLVMIVVFLFLGSARAALIACACIAASLTTRTKF